MPTYKLAEIESRFADLIWSHAPVSSGELVRLAADQLQWKKSTTYTVLRRLCERGLFQNNGGVVTPLLGRADYDALQSEAFVQEHFSGSLPGFLAAFARRKKLSDAEIAEIQRIIEEQAQQ